MLENTSGDRNILIGFPLSYGYTEDSMTNLDIGHNDIFDFSVKVNNANTPYKIYIPGINPELDQIPQYDEVYAFMVFFKSGEKKKIIIEYEMHPSFNQFGYSSSIYYILMSAHTMKGPIGKANISITFHFPTEYLHSSIEGFIAKDHPENTITYYFENFSPQKDLTVTYREKTRVADDWDNEVRPNDNTISSHLGLFYEAYKDDTEDSSFSDLFIYYIRAVSAKAALDPSLEQSVVSELSKYIGKIIDDPSAPFLRIRSIANDYANYAIPALKPLVDKAKKKTENLTKARIKQIDETIERIYNALEANPGDPGLINAILLAYTECNQYKIAMNTKTVQKYISSVLDYSIEKGNYDSNEVFAMLAVLPANGCGVKEALRSCIKSHTGELMGKKDKKKAETLSRFLQLFFTNPGNGYRSPKDLVAYNMLSYQAKRGIFGNKVWFLTEELFREKDLMRNAFYTIGNYYFGIDFEKAITYYGYSFFMVRSNAYLENNMYRFNSDLRPDTKDLLMKNLLTWEIEDENDAPSYYIAYNTCCAYTRLSKIDEAFEWFTIALRLDYDKIEAIAEKDTDLKILREKYAKRFREIIETKSGNRHG
jgi:hypothetical protein